MSVLNTPSAFMWTAAQPPFTVAQWQELEHQALVFKYLKAGLTVPPDLLVPIRKSLQLMMSQHHQSLGYYGKKIDPEPGRCRRTDGKKWRCSRDAHPDSKYCDRHMIRRRYRSRKPVESQSQPQPHSSSSSSSSHVVATSGTTTTASATGTGTFQTLPLHTNGTRQGFALGNGNNSMMEPLPLPSEVSKKDYRFGLNPEVDEHNFLQKDLGSVRYQGYDFTSDGMWSPMSQIPTNTVSESRDGSNLVSNCFQQRTMRDAELLNLNAARSKELVFSGQLSSAGCVKQEYQSPRDAELLNLNAARSKELVFSGQLSSAGCVKQEYQSPQSLISDWHWKKDLGSSSMEYRPSKDFNFNPDVNVDCNGPL